MVADLSSGAVGGLLGSVVGLLVVVDLDDLSGLLDEASVFDTVATSTNAPEDDGSDDEDGDNTDGNSNVEQNLVHKGTAVVARASLGQGEARRAADSAIRPFVGADGVRRGLAGVASVNRRAVRAVRDSGHVSRSNGYNSSKEDE